MITKIDNFLNNITMYRLVLYVLIALCLWAGILSFFHIFSFSPLAFFVSVCIFLLFCLTFNIIFAKIFRAQTNIESVYISALILSLIVSPVLSVHGIAGLLWASLWTIASKYLITLKRKLIFNPVAFGVFMTGIGLSQYASWWVGTLWMLPFVLIGGYAIARKIQREYMVITFLLMAFFTISGFAIMEGYDIVSVFQKTIAETPIFFFSLIMLTEPLTTPPTGTLRQYYAGIVGILYAPQMHLGSFYSSPETALLIGNLFSFLVSPKIRLVMLLKSKMQISDEITNFVFHTDDRISFTPGQYMEWTLSHARADSRGNRRYFTLASSPTEEDIVIGVRFNQNGSSFKSRLANLTVNDEITAGQISGDFTLPKNADAKVVLIAGGIGVTPFRSMIKYLLDTNQKRDITLLYTAKNPTEFVYKDLFDEAKEKINLRTAYTVTQPAPGWTGHTGKIDENFIRENVADAQKALFYISGPNSMVKSFKHMLIKMGVKKGKIKTDYFPGFA